jgi:hypothetical protein
LRLQLRVCMGFLHCRNLHPLRWQLEREILLLPSASAWGMAPLRWQLGKEMLQYPEGS